MQTLEIIMLDNQHSCLMTNFISRWTIHSRAEGGKEKGEGREKKKKDRFDRSSGNRHLKLPISLWKVECSEEYFVRISTRWSSIVGFTSLRRRRVSRGRLTRSFGEGGVRSNERQISQRESINSSSLMQLTYVQLRTKWI